MIGIAKGMRKIEHGYIEGGTLAAAIYTFDQVTPQRYRRWDSRRPDDSRLSLLQRRYRIGHSWLTDDEASRQEDRKQSDPLRR